MSETKNNEDLLVLTTDIVSAHLAGNVVAVSEIPLVIQSVYKTLSALSGGESVVAAQRPQPAVPVRKSITPDYIICLEDGKQLKMLKRHLKTSYNMTPDEYRERWNLPSDYPMVAPNYAKHRSRLAKQSGLGTMRKR